MEEDSVEECLHGNSVVNPIVPEQLPAPDVCHTDATTTAPTQEAPAATLQPNPEAMSLPERVDDDILSVKTAPLLLLLSLGRTTYHHWRRRKSFLLFSLRHRF